MNRKVVTLAAITSLVVILAACSSEAEPPDTAEGQVAVVTVDENGAEEAVTAALEQSSRKQKLNEMAFEARFIPAMFYALRASGEDSVNVLNDYKKNSSFMVRVTADNFNDEMLKYELSSTEEYYGRIDYLSFRVAQNVQLVLNKKDTTACLSHHFERNYGLSPELRLVFHFGVPEEALFQADQVQLIYNDLVYGNGPVKFQFDKKHLTHIKYSKGKEYEQN